MGLAICQLRGREVSRTYDNARSDKRGGGYDYGSKRLGNKYYLNCPGKYKSGKKKTHTLERAEQRRIIYKLQEEI